MTQPEWWPEGLEFPDHQNRTTVTPEEYGELITGDIEDDHLALEWIVWNVLEALRGAPEIDIAHATALMIQAEGFGR
jgi:hypothetical protein